MGHRLKRHIAQLEQQLIAVGAELADRKQELQAAQEVNHDLIKWLNRDRTHERS